MHGIWQVKTLKGIIGTYENLSHLTIVLNTESDWPNAVEGVINVIEEDLRPCCRIKELKEMSVWIYAGAHHQTVEMMCTLLGWDTIRRLTIHNGLGAGSPLNLSRMLDLFPGLTYFCFEDWGLEELVCSDAPQNAHTDTFRMRLFGRNHPLRHFRMDPRNSKGLRASNLLWLLVNCPLLKRLELNDIMMDADAPEILALLKENREGMQLVPNLKLLRITNLKAFNDPRFIHFVDCFAAIRVLDLTIMGDNGDYIAAQRLISAFLIQCPRLRKVNIQTLSTSWPELIIPKILIKPQLHLTMT